MLIRNVSYLRPRLFFGWSAKALAFPFLEQQLLRRQIYFSTFRLTVLQRQQMTTLYGPYFIAG